MIYIFIHDTDKKTQKVGATRTSKLYLYYSTRGSPSSIFHFPFSWRPSFSLEVLHECMKMPPKTKQKQKQKSHIIVQFTFLNPLRPGEIAQSRALARWWGVVLWHKKKLFFPLFSSFGWLDQGPEFENKEESSSSRSHVRFVISIVRSVMSAAQIQGTDQPVFSRGHDI